MLLAARALKTGDFEAKIVRRNTHLWLEISTHKKACKSIIDLSTRPQNQKKIKKISKKTHYTFQNKKTKKKREDFSLWTPKRKVGPKCFWTFQLQPLRAGAEPENVLVFVGGVFWLKDFR